MTDWILGEVDAGRMYHDGKKYVWVDSLDDQLDRAEFEVAVAVQQLNEIKYRINSKQSTQDDKSML